MLLHDVVYDVSNQVAQQAALGVQVTRSNAVPEKGPSNGGLWNQIPNVTSVFTDLKGSTVRNADHSPRNAAFAYTYFIRAMTVRLDRFGADYIALGLGLAACQKGLTVGFTTASALVNELMEGRDEMRLLNLQKRLARLKLLIIDELGFVPLSPTGAELLFEVFSQRYERGSILVTTNLPFDEWTEMFGSERLTGALLDRLTHHIHVIEMNGDSYRLRQSSRTASE